MMVSENACTHAADQGVAEEGALKKTWKTRTAGKISFQDEVCEVQDTL